MKNHCCYPDNCNVILISIFINIKTKSHLKYYTVQQLYTYFVIKTDVGKNKKGIWFNNKYLQYQIYEV